MSNVQMLRSVVKQRLTAAAEEICGLFERTIAEYEKELSASREENERHRRRLGAVLRQGVRIRRADVQQLLVVKEKFPPEQEDPVPVHIKEEQEDPEDPHIKEEQEELWTGREGEQLQELEEAGIKFTFTPLKSEDDDEEEAQCSQIHQRLHSSNWKLDPEWHPRPDTDEAEYVYEPETDDSRDWKETQEPQSDLNPLQNNEVPVSDVNCSTGNTSISSAECAGSSDHQVRRKRRPRSKTGVKPFSCSVCSQTFLHKGNLNTHMTIHTGIKPFSCLVCGKTFSHKGSLNYHMTIHTGVKPFSCPMCGKTFLHKGHLNNHMIIHTGVNPFSCSVCSQTFSQKVNLKRHMTIHTGKSI